MSSTNYDDDFIDRIARDMTDVEPSADLRDRIMASLSPAAGIRWSRGGAVIAVAAAIVLALSLPKMMREAPATSGPAPQVIAKGSSAESVAISAVQPVKQKEPGRSRRSRPVSADELAWLERSLRPLDAAPALLIEPIQPLRQSIAPISVEPFGPLPLDLAPLEVRSSGRQ